MNTYEELNALIKEINDNLEKTFYAGFNYIYGDTYLNFFTNDNNFIDVEIEYHLDTDELDIKILTRDNRGYYSIDKLELAKRDIALAATLMRDYDVLKSSIFNKGNEYMQLIKDLLEIESRN